MVGMKNLTIAAILFAATLLPSSASLSATSFPIADTRPARAAQATTIRTPAYRIASSAAVPHKFEHNGCLAYSEGLPRYLRKAGATRIHRLLFRWSGHSGEGFHAVVAYTDTVGNWIADNEHTAPKWTPAETMQERVALFVRDEPQLLNTEVIEDLAVK